jgi:CBS domain-containing protein/sporulation protein YlmC with PRC-barrel domain
MRPRRIAKLLRKNSGVADGYLFLTELLGLRVFDLRGRKIGAIRDAALVPLVHPVRVDRYLIGGDDAWFTIRHDQVQTIGLDGIFLREETLTPYHSDEYMLRLRRDLLDQQIIDSEGRKVVRVTDLTFSIREDNGGQALFVEDVDIGLRSVFRRLVQGVLPRTWIRRLQQPIPPHSIRWEVCNILEPDPQRRLRLNISTELLEKMHPADLADIVEELDPQDRQAIFESMDREVAAEALAEVDPDLQANILESLEAEKAAEIVEEMPADRAADVLAELDEQASEEILEELEREEQVRELLEFREDSAGGLMKPEFLALPAGATVADAVAAVQALEEDPGTLSAIFLVDDERRLKAVVPVARLFRRPPAAPLAGLALEPAIQVDVDAPQDRVAELFDKYNLLVLPVAAKDGRLAGVIHVDDIVTVLRQR